MSHIRLCACCPAVLTGRSDKKTCSNRCRQRAFRGRRKAEWLAIHGEARATLLALRAKIAVEDAELKVWIKERAARG